MCKKAVEGLDALCLEVTFGKAALIKTRQYADRLATLMVQQQPSRLDYCIRKHTNYQGEKLQIVFNHFNASCFKFLLFEEFSDILV